MNKKSATAALLFLAALIAGGAASAAEGFNLGGDALGGSGAKDPQTDPTGAGNLQADDESYKKVCDAFGEGFVYAANGVCIKIGGYVKFGTSFGGGSLKGR